MSPGAGTQASTPLASKLVARIGSEGPLSVAEYMKACLHDPEHGYYRRQRAIGREGDFITAPEISQMFGELIGLWCATVWHEMGSPARLNLVELGPGRGTLISDALRAARIVPDFLAALRLHLVECNAALKEAQRTTLGGAAASATWHESAALALAHGGDIGEGPMILIANEFLDTLPVEQFVYRNSAWHGRCVGLDPHGNFAFVDGATAADPPRLPETVHPTEGDVFEDRADYTAHGEMLATRARSGPMAALLIDYGHTQTGLGDTLQAVAAHRHVSPFLAPGEADLTAQVDFARFAMACRSAPGDALAVDGPVSQAEFLGALGIAERASCLMSANPAKAGTIETAVARLLAPSGMGTRFHAIGVRSTSVPPLPGLCRVDTRRRAP